MTDPTTPERYVIVDPATTTIAEGPFLWDGTTEWATADDPNLMLEADALAAGYSYPPPAPRAPRQPTPPQA